MTDEQKAALDWLLEAGTGHETIETNARHRSTVFAMLAEPRLPKEPTDSMVEAIWWACDGSNHRAVAEKIIGAIRTELTKPKTKTVEVWRVEYAQRDGAGVWRPFSAAFHNREDAQQYAKNATVNWDSATCIQVTGPHQQEVPA